MLDTVYEMGPIYSSIPFAGHNNLSAEWHHLTGKDLFYARYMIACLDAYERSFADRRTAFPDHKESLLHSHALQECGLYDDGLRKARVFAGKKNSTSPGIFYPDPERWPQFKSADQLRYEIRENGREMDRLANERQLLNERLVIACQAEAA